MILWVQLTDEWYSNSISINASFWTKFLATSTSSNEERKMAKCWEEEDGERWDWNRRGKRWSTCFADFSPASTFKSAHSMRRRISSRLRLECETGRASILWLFPRDFEERVNFPNSFTRNHGKFPIELRNTIHSIMRRFNNALFLFFILLLWCCNLWKVVRLKDRLYRNIE